MEDINNKILDALYSEEFKQYFEISMHDFTAEKLNTLPHNFKLALEKLIVEGYIKINQTSPDRENQTYSLTRTGIEKKLSGGF